MLVISDIREYVQKTAEIISTIAEMNVLICSTDKIIVGDSKNAGRESRYLSEDSVLSQTIDSRKMMIVDNCKNTCPGCISCPDRSHCDINAIVTIPIMDGKDLYGGIGVYANENESVTRLIKKNKDFIEFTHRMGELLVMKLKEEAQTTKLRETVRQLKNNSGTLSFDDIIGDSKELSKVKKSARLFAAGNSTILLQGESGTGKEVFARAIHTERSRGAGPFVAINCAALPENLIESELFGYVEGAFTGASKGARIGKFELADGGTLFLDEIGEIPIHLQAKLLRALQERKIQKVGGSKEINIDVRIIAATNRDLELLVKEGMFREDLYYRLSVIPIFIPSLRERKGDIRQLAEYFCNIYSKALNKDIFGLEKTTLKILSEYSWPGNIRELQNAIEYAVNISSNSYLKRTDLPEKILRGRKSITETGIAELKDLHTVEYEYIQKAIETYGNTLEGKEKAAQVLGISLATLYRKLKN